MLTWLNASVTGVSRSKMETSTTRVWESDLDLGDRGRKGLERALLDDDGFANLEVDVDLGGGVLDRLALLGLLFFEDRGEHGEDLIEAQRDRVVGVAHEAGDAGGVADGAPGGVRQVHADQDVAGDADAVDDLALSVLDLNDFLHRNLDFEDVIFHVQGLDAGLKVGLDAVFVAGVGVDDVPVTLLAAQLGLELVGGVDVGGGGCRGERVTGLAFSVAGFGVGAVGLIAAGVVGFFVGYGFSSATSDSGAADDSLGLVHGFHRGVLALIQLSLSYLELLLRHLVSCFLIA